MAGYYHNIVIFFYYVLITKTIIVDVLTVTISINI